MKKVPLFVFFSLAITGLGFAQTTAATDPVGFVTVGVPASTDAPMSLPLHRPSALHTTVVTVAGNVITVTATLTANQLATNPSSYYVRVVTSNGAVKGGWYDITANTATSGSNATITVDQGGSQTLQAAGLAANDVIEVVPYWTLNTLFPNGQGLTATTSIFAPQDEVGFMPDGVAGVNQQPASLNMYANDPGDGFVGWFDAGSFTATGDNPISPDSYIMIRNVGSAKSLSVTGAVPMSPAMSAIGRLQNGQPQDNFTANPFPVPITFSQSKLFESGAFAPTPNIFNPQDQLLVYDGSEVGPNSQPSAVYIYSTDTADLGTAGWYNAGTFAGPLDSSALLLPGHAFIVRKAPGPAGAAAWTTNPTY